MLETPSIRRYSFVSHPVFRVPTWIVIIRPVRSISRKGQVLRSGSSALSTAKAASAFRSFGTARHGQVGRFNRLTVVQGEKSLDALHRMERFCTCGQVGLHVPSYNH